MLLEQRLHTIRPYQFNPAGSAILGTTQRWNIDRTWPLEGILVVVSLGVTGAFTQTAVGATTTPDNWENILNILQHINLTVNDGLKPARSVVDTSGVRLLEYNSQTSTNCPPEVWAAVQLAYQHGAAGIPVGAYQIPYYIPIVDAGIAEPLRSRLYLPIHKHVQDPVLTLTFNTLAAMGLTVGTLANVTVDILLVRREVTPASESFLVNSKLGTNPYGYIDSDLIEQPFNVPLGSAQEVRFPLSIPGSYTNLLMTQYRGGAPLTKDIVDTKLGDTIANNLGNEGVWRLETGLVTKRNWSWKHLKFLNGFTRSQNNITTNAAAAAIPALGNIAPDLMPMAATATSLFQTPAITFMDFLADMHSGQSGNELGSVLDCNTPAANNLKMEIIGTPASVATNPSYIFAMGRRLIGDLSGWQKF